MIRRALPVNIAIGALGGKLPKEWFVAICDDEETAEAQFAEHEAKQAMQEMTDSYTGAMMQ